MVTILPALRQVRKDLVKILDRASVRRVCQELDHMWRSRKLDPYTTLHLFILQVLHQNTAMTHLPHLSGERFTASAYCQARQRLPAEFFGRLVDLFAKGLRRSGHGGTWCGHRIMIPDGSSFSMPDTEVLQEHFGQPGMQKRGCGFPVAHMLALMDGDMGFLHDVIVSPLRTHDMAHAAELHPKLSPGDVVLADRAFCSYAHLVLLSQAQLHAVLRVHQRQIVDFRPHRPSSREAGGKGRPSSRWIRRLGHDDQVVEWHKSSSRPKWMTAEQYASLPKTLVVREIRRRIRISACRVQSITLVTTLLDADRYPAAEIFRLYKMRWQIEVNLRDLKTTLGMRVLKGRKVETVLKEVRVFALVYNLVRLVMVKAARRQRVCPHRVSFTDALRWLQPPKPAQRLPDLVVNPVRPNRVEPRCIKRRQEKYTRLTMPRKKWQKLLRKQIRAA